VAKRLSAPIPRIAMTAAESAAALGIGPDHFEEHVAPELKVIRRGRKRLFPCAELERWALESAEHVHDRRGAER
jgi:hypothetical protein